MPAKTAARGKSASTSKKEPLRKTSGNAVKKSTAKKSSGQKKSVNKPRSNLLEASIVHDEEFAAGLAAGSNIEQVRAGIIDGIDEVSKTQAEAQPLSTGKTTDDQVTNYVLLVRMNHTSDPTITRLLSVPSTLTFSRFHLVLQAAFGWANYHMYQFYVNELPNQLTEENHEPGWRKLKMTIRPNAEMMAEMDMDGEWKEASEISLADIFENDDVELLYEYDMGDGWEHNIALLGKELPNTRRAMLIPDFIPITCYAGEGHPCAEDCGGPPGWDDLKELFAKPRSKDEDNRKQWYKTLCANGDKKGLDPYKWDIFDVNDRLIKLAKEPGFLG